MIQIILPQWFTFNDKQASIWAQDFKTSQLDIVHQCSPYFTLKGIHFSSRAASQCPISFFPRPKSHHSTFRRLFRVANETANLWSLRDAWDWNSNALWVLELISILCRDFCSQSSWFRLQPCWDLHEWLVGPVLFDGFVMRRVPDKLHGCFLCLYQQDTRKAGLSMRLRQFNLLVVSLLFNFRAVHQWRVTDPSVLAT